MQEGCGAVGPEEGTGMLRGRSTSVWRQAEEARGVQPGEGNALGRHHVASQSLKGAYKQEGEKL